MMLSVDFYEHDFSVPILIGLHMQPVKLSWSVYGGPEFAEIRLDGEAGKLLQMTRLIRCPVQISDSSGRPVWWGFVQDVLIFLDEVKIKVSLADLYNRVTVHYTFISPDSTTADDFWTTTANFQPSQDVYGVKAITLHRSGIDDNFAEELRDTFLNLSAWPRSILSQRLERGSTHARVRCSGWFKTLAWQGYQNTEGFYANDGSGPGTFNFGQSSSYRTPAQRFTPGAPVDLKYAYFQLRSVGGCTRNLNAQLRDASGVLLAASGAVSGVSLSSTYYSWVKFTFSTPYTLSAGTTYMIGVTGNGTNPTQYFALRTDENQTFTSGYGQYYNGVSWVTIPSITNPGGAPDLIFRALCISDTGAQISDIASAGNQFFTRITEPPTGVFTCPFRDNGYDCLSELQALMDLGTSNHRRILARITSDLHLEFYEQPDPNLPAVYLDQRGQFLTFQGMLLKAYSPPVGQYASYSGSEHILMPFDKARVPVCFIERAVFYPDTGQVEINPGSRKLP